MFWFFGLLVSLENLFHLANYVCIPDVAEKRRKAKPTQFPILSMAFLAVLTYTPRMIILLAAVLLADLSKELSSQIALLLAAVVIELCRELRSFIFRKRVRKLESEVEPIIAEKQSAVSKSDHLAK